MKKKVNVNEASGCSMKLHFIANLTLEVKPYFLHKLLLKASVYILLLAIDLKKK